MPLGSAESPEGDAAAILASLPQALLVVGADDRIISLHGQADMILARPRGGLKGAQLASVEGLGPMALPMVARSRREQAPFSQMDVPLSAGLEGHQRCDLTTSPLGQDRVLLMIQPRRIRSIAQSRDEVEGAARSVRGLASMMAHELRNPLAGIRGAAQLLARKLGAGDRHMTDLISREVARVEGLVDELERFAPMAVTDMAPVNVHEVLDHVADLAQGWQGARLDVVRLYDPSLPLAHASFDRLVQVFLNLVKNASEALDMRGEITLRTAYRHEGVLLRGPDGTQRRVPLEICVEDRGPGIPADIRPHLFDPFVSGRDGGSGLGLALVARYITDMGGTVSVADRSGGGSRFKVRLPQA
ncbi:two-component system sensor histidine kinase NtrB [Yunchengibacter salinarum]|uniref:two-component system sensor histidine kinase NtrB n=1 Tax=Yunchengibacter salinarum TaxID=3133399 RepID=UPI0035B57523